MFTGECCGTTPVVHRLSPLARVSDDGEVHILECVRAGFIHVEPLTDPEGKFPHLFFDLTIQPENPEPEVGFRARYIPITWGKAMPKVFNLSPLLQPRHNTRVQSFEQAIRGRAYT